MIAKSSCREKQPPNEEIQVDLSNDGAISQTKILIFISSSFLGLYCSCGRYLPTKIVSCANAKAAVSKQYMCTVADIALRNPLQKLKETDRIDQQYKRMQTIWIWYERGTTPHHLAQLPFVWIQKEKFLSTCLRS